jgi:hypothetical protein
MIDITGTSGMPVWYCQDEKRVLKATQCKFLFQTMEFSTIAEIVELHSA